MDVTGTTVVDYDTLLLIVAEILRLSRHHNVNKIKRFAPHDDTTYYILYTV